jgi:hypothetical protein
VLRERQARDVQVAIEQGVEPPSLEDVFLSVVRGERATLTPSDGART